MLDNIFLIIGILVVLVAAGYAKLMLVLCDKSEGVQVSRRGKSIWIKIR